MKKNKPTRLYLKCLLLSLPFIALVAFYIIKDPFMVIRHYRDYDHSDICQCEGSIGWFKYKMLRHRMHYDSFIMGSSCTKAFNTGDWNRYIHARPYRLFSNSEEMSDVNVKLEALYSQRNQQVKNLLIVAEKDFFTRTEPQGGVMHIMPPDVSGKSEITYQTTFLQGFFSPMFLWRFIKFHVTHRYEHCMRGIINDDGPTRTFYTNDAILPNETKISTEGEEYWDDKSWDNAKQHKFVWHEAPRTIYTAQIDYLNKMKELCQRHGTNVKIAIGPRLDKTAINHDDVNILKHIFGSRNVIDFSDKAHEKYSDYHNFYDNIHYRIILGRDMMKELYQ
jgi:hypothetical protein